MDKMVKRYFDLVFSAMLLFISFVPLLLLGLLVRCKLGPPILFKQQRPGLHGRPFTIYKFRTMRDAIDTQGQPLPDHERLTPLGRFLRASSLDELPGLFNVLRGDMSLVGPRPLLMRYTPFYTPEEALRMTVRPGITGWAQINGRNTVSWDQRLAMDVWYVRHWSMALDFRILLSSVARVFSRSGVVVDPNSIMLDLDVERSLRNER